MKKEQIEALNEFLGAVKELRKCGVIRSEKYLGDIAEFIVQEKFSVKLCENQREKGYDGLDTKNKKVQIKSHNAPIGTNIQIGEVGEGNERKYDDLYIVLGPESLLKQCSRAVYEVYVFNDYKQEYRRNENKIDSFGQKNLYRGKVMYLDELLQTIPSMKLTKTYKEICKKHFNQVQQEPRFKRGKKGA